VDHRSCFGCGKMHRLRLIVSTKKPENFGAAQLPARHGPDFSDLRWFTHKWAQPQLFISRDGERGTHAGSYILAAALKGKMASCFEAIGDPFCVAG